MWVLYVSVACLHSFYTYYTTVPSCYTFHTKIPLVLELFSNTWITDNVLNVFSTSANEETVNRIKKLEIHMLPVQLPTFYSSLWCIPLLFLKVLPPFTSWKIETFVKYTNKWIYLNLPKKMTCINKMACLGFPFSISLMEVLVSHGLASCATETIAGGDNYQPIFHWVRVRVSNQKSKQTSTKV